MSGVRHVLQHRRTQERRIDQAPGGIVDHLGIDEGELRAPDAVCLHLLKLAENLGLFNGRPEPPPPHHGLGIIRRIFEMGFEIGDRRLRWQRTRR